MLIADCRVKHVANHDDDNTKLLQDSTIASNLVMSIVDETFTLQKQFGNIRSFNSRVAHRVTVVGDLHGQLPDLLTIFQINGMPDDGNPYVSPLLHTCSATPHGVCERALLHLMLRERRERDGGGGVVIMFLPHHPS